VGDVDIAFVSNVVFPFVKGGAEKRIYEIGRRLATAGHDVTVYGRHYWDGPPEITYEGMDLRAVAPAADLYAGERRSILEAMGFATGLAPALYRTQRREPHDVIDVSVFPFFPVLSTALAAPGSTPIVTTWHEVWGAYWEEYLGRLAPFGKTVEWLCANVDQQPVAVSGLTAERLAAIGPDRDVIEVIPNGIDLEKVRSAPLPSESGNDRYDVLFVGRLIEDKNVDLLLEAFDDVAATRDATLGIIGEGPERPRLEALRDSLEHPDLITFLGFVESDEDVLGYMRDADVFVSLSTREGFGIVFLEAMAADCTVITVDHPASNAAAVVGEAGYTIPLERSAVEARLAEALDGDRPEEDPVERAEEFEWARIADRAEAYYRQVAAADSNT
jgi:glycosyltransferase involved in cell wall biosynthesis